MPNFLELYSASLITVMFIASVFIWVRDEVRRRRRARLDSPRRITIEADNYQRVRDQRRTERMRAAGIPQ
ncbi:hypothetical protein SEA_KIKO_44 [Gordonia phage Kiko]|uniref:hypothetical protein n=1 Tax=Gordonia rubripertincta TaxID=36822 RepID=UPI000FDFA1BE|nr:hypothetical protein [Gordonia rubripertincta]AZV00768.1 hypothetical protein SEA_KIKO_44 [Gordonia phage Kiko]QMU22533.1 hypothetical protein H3V45_08720 [Gordonia rubripertincta]